MIRPLQPLWRTASRLLTAVGFLFVLATLTPVDYWLATVLSDNWNDPPGDVLIVLGGSTVDSGLVGGSSYWRGVYAALYHRQAGYRKIILSGGPEGEGWDFGRGVAVSDIYALLEGIEGVDHIEDLVFQGTDGGDFIPIPPNALVANGEHSINARLNGGG